MAGARLARRLIALFGAGGARALPMPISPSKSLAFERAAARASERPVVVLARPFDPGNVGPVARAMLNFGLTELRVVSPASTEWRGADAETRACGAIPVLESAREYGHMRDAVADLSTVYATTARLRDAFGPDEVLSPSGAAHGARERLCRGERVGFLFGSEKNGLDNAELEYAHALVTVPTEPGFSSLNLAQAVLLLAYEWSATAADAAPTPPAPTPADVDARGAPLGQVSSMLDWWEDALWTSGFLRADGPAGAERSRAEAAMTKLRRLVVRAAPTEGEASLLRGALRALVEPKK